MKKVLLFTTLVIFALSCSKENVGNNNNSRTSGSSELDVLKQEVELLKSQVASLTSDFFEVDGLRFDRNGTLISLAKIENEVTQKSGESTLTTTRTYDAQGRLIQIYRVYSGLGQTMGTVPYNWQKVMYQFGNKTCRTITQTNKNGMTAGTPYEEVIKDTEYW